MAGEGVQFRAVDENGFEPEVLRLGEALWSAAIHPAQSRSPEPGDPTWGGSGSVPPDIGGAPAEHGG